MRSINVTAGLIIGMAAPCLAQSALVRVTHDDPDGIVTPGQSVEISALISWQGARAFWEIQGGVRATPDVGVAANPLFPYSVAPNAGLILNPGTPAAGSIEGTHIRWGDFAWAFALTQPPPQYPFGSSGGLKLVTFQWTAPVTTGIVNLDWEPSPSAPDTFMVVNQPAPVILPIPTTYLGTSLTVIPAPSAALVLVAGLGGLALGRRRRSTRETR